MNHRTISRQIAWLSRLPIHGGTNPHTVRMALIHAGMALAYSSAFAGDNAKAHYHYRRLREKINFLLCFTHTRTH